MPTKTKSTPSRTVSFHGYAFPSGAQTRIYNTLIPGSTETITWENGPRTLSVYLNGSKTKIPFIKNCLHIKEHIVIRPWVGYKSGNFGLTAGLQFPEFYESADAWSPLPTPGAIESLDIFIKDSFREMRPTFKADTNLLNFIYELRELATVIPDVNTIRLALEGFKKSITDFFNSSSKVYSEAVLNLNYGILPLISDIEALNNSLVSYNRKLDDFIKRAGKLQKRKFRRTYQPDRAIGKEEIYPYGETYRIDCDTTRCARSATLYYYYNIVGLPPRAPESGAIPDIRNSREFSRFLEYMGLRSGALAESLWNALPFSFLIDYVIKVGDWLGQLDLGVIDIEYVPISFCYSEQRTDVLTHSMRGSRGTNGESSGSTEGYCIKTLHSYRRTRLDDLSMLFLDVDTTPNTDLFSDREQMLTANLINVLRK